jgi:hypothetical protein
MVRHSKRCKAHNLCIIMPVLLPIYESMESGLFAAATGSLPQTHSKHIFPATRDLTCTAIYLLPANRPQQRDILLAEPGRHSSKSHLNIQAYIET